ncbi:hypothetical protein [Maledivibacter halophilus]|uniref:Pre-peptidase C-terminal domain-containing protein n=1 Tax=Maledivibacter halophilus TaxID=36842 RepID=A0A1T5KG18_9FIRM|nr:hypothetical protein [Maledivibacter halophilus]SKC62643.1 hypothetical protein SAMN02194393_01772 [Maledivibacter halophilus]
MKKFLVFLCVICMVLSTGTVAFATERYFEQEPNNSRSTADGPYTVKENEYHISIDGIVSESDKVDWFKVRSEKRGGSAIVLRLRDEDVDYDIYLYDDRGRMLGSSELGKGEDERIYDIYIRPNETYYILVEHRYGIPKQAYRILFDVFE